MAAALSIPTKVWADKINGAWRRSAASVIEAGQILLDCKKAVRPGDFQRMVKRELDFGPSMARKFMAIAGDQRLVERSHENAPMPKHWTTLYELHQLDDSALEKALSNGKPQRADVQKLRAPKPTITDAQYTEVRSPAADTPLPPGDAVPSPTIGENSYAADALTVGDEVIEDDREDRDMRSSLFEDSDDPQTLIEAGFASLLRGIRKKRAQDAASDYRRPILSDDVTFAADWLMDFEASVRSLYGVGNEAALSEMEAESDA